MNMKKTSVLFGAILAAGLTAGLQAYAITPTVFTDNDTANMPFELVGSHGDIPYNGVFNALFSGSTQFSSSAYTLVDSGGLITLTIIDEPNGGSEVDLKLGSIDLGEKNFTTSTETQSWSLTTTAEYSYIQTSYPAR